MGQPLAHSHVQYSQQEVLRRGGQAEAGDRHSDAAGVMEGDGEGHVTAISIRHLGAQRAIVVCRVWGEPLQPGDTDAQNGAAWFFDTARDPIT